MWKGKLLTLSRQTRSISTHTPNRKQRLKPKWDLSVTQKVGSLTKAVKWLRYFRINMSRFSASQPTLQQHPHQTHQEASPQFKAIDELSPSAAADPDGYPAILLKNCKIVLSEPLVILWKASMESGIVPDILKRSIITPIHKGGSRSAAANYRPIALTSHIIKLFEKILRKHIVQYMNDHNLFNENQHGFRSGRSCLSQLLEHFDTILNIIEDNNNADVIYLDFA